MIKVKRLREIDFLRGVAISLVLFRHCHLFDFTDRIGWIGVDLFFVLSGFLVSGLLFREYKKYGNIKPQTFLIRRGFKIYPIYYLMYSFYLVPLLLTRDISISGLIGDLTFMQNYVSGWGYAFEASWSLAVEEHFYFGLALALWISLKHQKLTLYTDEATTGLSQLETIILSMMVFCLLLRVTSNLDLLDSSSTNDRETQLRIARNFTMTHLRIDSLLMGVLISYLYQFRKERLLTITKVNKGVLLLLMLVGLCWTPFTNPVFSFFVKTVGFTLLYLTFGLLLVIFITYERINQQLDRFFTPFIVNSISQIGYCSYSIYIVHPFINMLFIDHLTRYVPMNQYVLFLVTSTISISLGFWMTNTIESYFLGIRDKHYPNRSAKPVFESTLAQ